MSNLIAKYDGIQHCTVVQETKRKSVSSDACPVGGGKGEEFSPAELVGSGLASCMLFMMGIAARRNNLNIADTIVEVEVVMTDKPVSRIGEFRLVFKVPSNIPSRERIGLEKATSYCPIKPSLHPDIIISTEFHYGIKREGIDHAVAIIA